MDQASAISLIIAAGSVSAVVFGYFGYSRGVKKDSFAAGTIQGSQEADMAYIKRRVDDILLEQRDTNKSINVLAERVTRVEDSAKSAQKRLDEIEESKGESQGV